MLIFWLIIIILFSGWIKPTTKNLSATSTDSLLLQGHRLELRMEDLRKSTDSLLFLHLIQLDYTFYLEYKIDSLINELDK